MGDIQIINKSGKIVIDCRGLDAILMSLVLKAPLYISNLALENFSSIQSEILASSLGGKTREEIDKMINRHIKKGEYEECARLVDIRNKKISRKVE
jgi:bifunctional DNase/RNase